MDGVRPRYRRVTWGGSKAARGTARIDRPAGPTLGGPPDFVSADDEGVYALAGAIDRDGVLPYWWMTWARAATLRHVPSRPLGA